MPSLDAYSTIIGAVIGAATSIAVPLITRIFDERKERREWIAKVAAQNWEYYHDAAKRLGGNVQPLEVFVIHAAKLLEIIDSTKDVKEISAKMRELRAITTEVSKYSLGAEKKNES